MRLPGSPRRGGGDRHRLPGEAAAKAQIWRRDRQDIGGVGSKGDYDLVGDRRFGKVAVHGEHDVVRRAGVEDGGVYLQAAKGRTLDVDKDRSGTGDATSVGVVMAARP